MFWLVMVAVAAVVAVTYGVLGFVVRPARIPAESLRRMRNGACLAVGWTAVCLGNLALHPIR